MKKTEKQGGDVVLKFSEHKRKRAADLENDIDALFQLPLPDFTGARNALAGELKKSGRGDESASVKSLAKPSVSAWAVNQLYWNHRDAFDKLLELGERFHKAQTSGKIADMREVIDARRERLSQLADLAARVLRDAGHNPAPDTVHRITTTLEGISAYASRDDGPQPGRLTHDVDPPGFESFGGFVPATTKQKAVDSRQSTPARSPATPATQAPKSITGAVSARKEQAKRKLEEANKAKIAAAKASLQDAKRSLNEARVRAQRLQSTQRHAEAGLKIAEKRLKEAKAAAEEAASEVKDAERTVEKATRELDSLS